jgi:transcriptional regulator of acetoin/glycerol metabolism
MLMTLSATKGNKKEAAQKLGISRRALYDKLKKHALL